MALFVEAVVVFFAATLAAGAIASAFTYVGERQWDAAVFLTLAATATIWYGLIVLQIVWTVFAA